ncbi:MAG: tetratricopeptide repeat protein [Rhizobiaceae bacterium]|nr:tetratricopeptide repeat protein [Rhizobiaceae bacterium]
MTTGAGQSFGVIGPLAAFPLRLAVRHANRVGSKAGRGVRRQTTHAVVGRKLLEKETDARIAARLEAARRPGLEILSENGFLRALGLKAAPDGATIEQSALLQQSGLTEPDFELLRLFDAFESDAAPFTFRDAILARKFAGLIAGGADWHDIARSIHRSGPVASLTAKSLHPGGQGTIYARHDDGLAELSGQMLFDLGGDDAGLDDVFADAEEAEADGEFDDAIALYARCLAIDPADAVAAFNRANCLRAVGRDQEAANDYVRALKHDPGFVEAWFNLADLTVETGSAETARSHLRRALAIDPGYADAIFNLARLEFEADELDEAKRLWSRYLELDSASDWARTAHRGIQFVDLHLSRKSTA